MNTKQDPWEDYRKRKRWFIWTMATFLPGIAIIGKSLEWLFQTQAVVGLVGGAWMLAYTIAGHRFAYFRCPRCKQEFYGSFLINWNIGDVFPFAKRCSRCGLEKWKDPESPQANKGD